MEKIISYKKKAKTILICSIVFFFCSIGLLSQFSDYSGKIFAMVIGILFGMLIVSFHYISYKFIYNDVGFYSNKTKNKYSNQNNFVFVKYADIKKIELHRINSGRSRYTELFATYNDYNNKDGQIQEFTAFIIPGDFEDMKDFFHFVKSKNPNIKFTSFNNSEEDSVFEYFKDDEFESTEKLETNY